MRWTLHARRGLALFWPFLHLLDDGAKPAAHGISRLIGNFQHAGMAVLHGLDTGGHIGDATDRKHLHSAKNGCLSFALGSRFLYRAHLKICGKYKKQVHHLSIKNFGFREKVLHLLFFM